MSATGVYAERVELHMGIVWIKALTLKTGHANVIKHVDPVLERLVSGALDPSPLVTHHMRLDDAAEAYDVYDRRRRSRSCSRRERRAPPRSAGPSSRQSR